MGRRSLGKDAGPAGPLVINAGAVQAKVHQLMNAEAGHADLTEALDRTGLDELRELRKNLDRAIASFESRRRREAMSAAEQVAKQHGFKLAQLVGGRRAGKAKGTDEGTSASRVAAYVNPDNSEQVWSGRRPGCVPSAAFSSGGSIS